MMSLFELDEAENRRQARPLAARMRPTSLDEFVGQSHFLGEGKLLQRLIRANRLTAALFYGPSGTGKTTLAHLLAQATSCRFCQLNAVTSGVKDLRDALEGARDALSAAGERTLLFIDEIHRFNKAQQDALLPDVEEGVVALVGATTANPFFAVNSALVSRSSLFEFLPLTTEEIELLLRRALADESRGLGAYAVEADDDALQWLASICDGDARRALGALEIAILSSNSSPIRFTRALAEESVQKKAIQYDATGDAHYDSASALIKSMRGSDPDASLYWLSRMLCGGEEVLFLCRRLVIFASEDIGNADPHALPLAVATMQACQFVGLPECQLNLAQCVTYLACAPKSNASTVAIAEALDDVRGQRLLPVPRSLRDAHYAGAARLEHGKGLLYPHDAEEGVAAQDYLGVEKTYYRPVPRGAEAEIGVRLAKIRQTLRGDANLPRG